MTATYDQELEQIVQSVFATMLNLDVLRVDEPASPAEDWLLATVNIAGAWTGTAVLALSQSLAVEAAAAMLPTPSPEVGLADQQEVAAELVNMIGGNLKSLLPGPSFLSLPTIVSGRAFGLQVHDAELLDDLVLAGEAGCLRVRLYARAPALA